MMLALQIICLVSVGLVLYSYLGYPILLAAYARLFGRVTPPTQFILDRTPEQWPFVSLVIAAYREERMIMQRINNALLMDYPADRLEIIIGCDGNEDGTGDIVASVQDSRIRLMQFPQRRGKPSVLNDCVAAARGEIIAFSDANTFYEPDALKQLVAHFDHLPVGGVVGQLLLIDPHTGANVDGIYWKYENFLKRCEGKVGALLGANGAIYALRKSLWEPIASNTIVDDFLIGMRLHLQSRLLVFEEHAVAHEESAPTIHAEFHRRARIGAGGFQSLTWLLPLLSPAYGTVAWAFWSHKILRWFAPLFLIVGFATNCMLLDIPLFQYLFALQMAGYIMAASGRYVSGRTTLGKLVRVTTMFCDMNAALAVGFWRWISNRQSGAWKRTARTEELAVASQK